MSTPEDRLVVRLGGNREVSVRGTIVILVLVIVVCAGSIGYLIERASARMVDELKTQRTLAGIESARRIAEHAAITRGQDRTSCLLALSPADREVFRKEWRQGAFAIWCPWIFEDARVFKEGS